MKVKEGYTKVERPTRRKKDKTPYRPKMGHWTRTMEQLSERNGHQITRWIARARPSDI